MSEQSKQQLANAAAATTTTMVHSQPQPNYSPLQRPSLYVGDLHPETTETDLQNEFSRIVPVASLRLCRCSITGKSLCYAYVNFFSLAQASKAMACLNYTQLKGKPMRISWCRRDPYTRKFGIGNLFVKNLHPSVNGTYLLGLFCQFGTVLSCKVAEENGKSKGFGFVQFDSEESAMNARAALHDTIFLGRKLYVSKFVKKDNRIVTPENSNFTNLYVKNLNADMTDGFLREMFSKFGKVLSAVIMTDGEGKSRGFGFVNFQSPEEARRAVDALNGVSLGSKVLYVGRAQKKAERSEILKQEYKDSYNFNIENSKASTLYVKNLHISVDDKKLRELFGGFGQITSSRVICHDNGVSKGFGFVCFSTPAEARTALDALNGTIFEGRTLYVAMALSKDRFKAYQNYYEQYPVHSLYPSNSTVFHPGQHRQFYFSYHPSPHPFSQPIYYRHQYPSVAQHYRQQNLSSHTLTYPIPNVSTQELNHGNSRAVKPINRKKSVKISRPPENSFKGKQQKAVVNNKKNIGNALYPLVQNLQPEYAPKITGMLLEMNDAEIMKLINSPNSLDKQVHNAVQVLKESNINARTNGDGGSKSACCLSY